MAEKRKCPMSTYPTDCKDRCTECECGGKGMTHGLICKDKLLDKLEDMYLNTGLSGNSNYSNGVADEYEQVVDAICNMPPVADVQPVNQWISVDEKLPKTGESVLVCVAINKNLKGFGECKPEMRIGWLDDGDKWALQFSNMDYSEVLCWMPLPEPPKDGDAK